MTEYGKKLKELRQQMERKIYLDSLLAQLNEEKSALEYEIQPLADTLDKAMKKMDRAQRGGIFALFNKNDDTAYTELSAARTAYNDAMSHLDSLKHRIQNTFNEAAGLSDAKRLYTNLMEEIDTALAQGKTNVITQTELEEEYAALQKSRKEKLANAIDAGNSLLDYLEYVMDGNMPYTRPQDIKKELYKFRLAVSDADISTNIAVDFTSYRHFYSKVAYPGSYLNNIDGHLPVVRYDFPLTPKEMLAEVELTAQNVTQTIEMLNHQLEHLSQKG